MREMSREKERQIKREREGGRETRVQMMGAACSTV